jgi:hypothetical protein
MPRSPALVQSWQELARLANEDLATYDVAEYNLACAVGLPDTKDLDIKSCLQRLDVMASYTDRFTERLLPQFRRRPEKYHNSEAYFRVLALITALQRDLGLRYNPSKIPVDAALQTADVFVHGALLGHGGTCASLPVVYAAVGRRLSYPLKLVQAKGQKWGHLFARWDAPGGERFNIEATSQGLNCYPDDYYRTGIYMVEEQIEQQGCLLTSMTPREELATFIAERAYRWRDLGNLRQVANALAWATAIAPKNGFYVNTLNAVMREWGTGLARLEPPGYPMMYFTWPPRRFPETLPLQYEKDILCLEATENILKNPEYDSRWWAPMRQGQVVEKSPIAVIAVCRPDKCDISVRFTHN